MRFKTKKMENTVNITKAADPPNSPASGIFSKSNFLSTTSMHIIAEVLALGALAVYFSNKNKNMMKHIEELALRLEEQEEIIAKHDEVLKKLIAKLNGQNSSQASSHVNANMNSQNEFSSRQANASSSRDSSPSSKESSLPHKSTSKSKPAANQVEVNITSGTSIMDLFGCVMSTNQAKSSAENNNDSFIVELNNDNDADSKNNLDEELKEELEDLH